MANLLAHALFALALFSVLHSLLGGAPLSEFGFYAALISLGPDLEGPRGRTRTPQSHSVAFGLLWSLLLLAFCSLAGWMGLLSHAVLPLFLSACLIGVASHWFLDAFGEPGIFTRPQAEGAWGRLVLLADLRAPNLNLLVSGASIGTILTLLVLY
ncbi:MAG: hypothetical protein ACE5JE_04295 [Thermoplasmata archaeon]